MKGNEVERINAKIAEENKERARRILKIAESIYEFVFKEEPSAIVNKKDFTITCLGVVVNENPFIGGNYYFASENIEGFIWKKADGNYCICAEVEYKCDDGKLERFARIKIENRNDGEIEITGTCYGSWMYTEDVCCDEKDFTKNPTSEFILAFPEMEKHVNNFYVNVLENPKLTILKAFNILKSKLFLEKFLPYNIDCSVITSKFQEWMISDREKYDISLKGGGKNYGAKYYSVLAPKMSTWEEINGRTIDCCDYLEEERNRLFICQYYDNVLFSLDPEEVYRELGRAILMSEEDNDCLNHRHIVAAWFEIFLGVVVQERSKGDVGFHVLERPDYIKAYLEEIIRQRKDMKGFKSLRALYLYEKSEKLENEIPRICSDINLSDDERSSLVSRYEQAITYLKLEATREEESYLKVEKTKGLLKSL